MKNKQVWFTSDTHAFHRNICIGVSQWKAGATRDFTDEMVMTDHLISQINKYVKEDDILYHLGDWSFGGPDKILQFRNAINCKTIHLILGNHDDNIAHNRPIPVDVAIDILDTMHKKYEFDGTEVFANSHISKYAYIRYNPSQGCYVRPGDLFTSIERQNEIFVKVPSNDHAKWEKTRFFLSHYAHRVWNGSHRGIIHLYGHSHGSLEPYGRSLDVGVDNIFNLVGEYRPVNIQEVINLIGNKQIEMPDHHGNREEEL